MDRGPGHDTLANNFWLMATNLPLVVRTQSSQFQLQIPIGPGRLLTKAYRKGGDWVGKKCGRLAHQWGYGIDAATVRLSQELESRNKVLVQPAHFCGIGGELEKDCWKVLEYALPTETCTTQLKAFKSIIYLTTQFPGLRHVFGRCKVLQAAGATKACTINMWMGDDLAIDVSERWIFFLRFAASCIFEDDGGVSSVLENADSKIDDLGYIPVDSGEFSIIERLLVASESLDESEPWIAIRYLGTILASRSFWVQQSHSNHRTVTKKLFQRVTQLVDDMDMECWAKTDVRWRKIHGDIEGIDILTCALLNGVEIWYQQGEPRPSGPSLKNFQQLMAFIRHPVAQDLLPRSFATASPEYVTLVGMLLRRESVEVLVLSNTPSSSQDSNASFVLPQGASSPSFPTSRPRDPETITVVNDDTTALGNKITGREPKSEDKIIGPGDSRITDIVIPIMGPTGVGKSTFINTLLGTFRMAAGTVTIQHAFISDIPNHPSLMGRRIVLVDTPGFDNDSETYHQRISSWLASSYGTDMRIAGVIYLHDISQNLSTMLGPTRRNFQTIRKLCGEDTEAAVIIGTTRWEQVEPGMSEQREEELSAVYRKILVTGGAKVYRFEGSEKSAWRMVDAILSRFEQTYITESKDSLGSPISQDSERPLGPPLAPIQPQRPSLASDPTLLPGDQTLTITNEDIIIAVMGPTGTGKSSFINALMRSSVAVTSDALSSCTLEVTAFGCLHPNGSGRKVVIVDTPGFDNTEGMDYQILKTIAQWLEQTYQRRITLTGILQFHRIAESRMRGTPLKNLRMFQILYGDDALKNVILTTTFWDQVSEEVGGKREAQLISEVWDPLIRHGSRVARFQLSTYESAWDLIDQFDISIQTTTPRPALTLQTEMVDRGMKLEETAAFKYLKRRWRFIWVLDRISRFRKP